MNCSRTSSRRFSRLIPAGLTRAVPASVLLTAIAASFLLSLSCAEEIARPTHGTLEVRLASRSEAGYLGSRISANDSVLVEYATRNTYSFILPSGSHLLKLEKECGAILPDDLVETEVRPGLTSLIRWEIELEGIEVTSSPAGAHIFLDGHDTGHRTPATICADPGDYDVGARLLGACAGSDSVKAVTVDAGEVVSVYFDLSPLPQQRGVLLEMYTYTMCQYCPPAAQAAENLYGRGEITSRGYASAKVHVNHPADPFHNEAGLAGRIDLFGAQSGQPIIYFSGMDRRQGTGGMTVDQLTDAYAERVSAIQDRSQDHPAALYWLSLDYTPGVEILGTVRIMLLQELSEPCDLELWVLNYKDQLEARGRTGMETFHKVVREYKSGGALQSLGLSAPGDYRDVEVRFTLGWDVDGHGNLWPEEIMGMIAFVQDMSTLEVFQMAHKPVP